MGFFRLLCCILAPLLSCSISSTHVKCSTGVFVSKFNYSDFFTLQIYHRMVLFHLSAAISHISSFARATQESAFPTSQHAWSLISTISTASAPFFFLWPDHCHDEPRPYQSHCCILPTWQHHLQSPELIKHTMVHRLTNACIPP